MASWNRHSHKSWCSLPGCNLPTFREMDGTVYDYCGITHARKGEELKRRKDDSDDTTHCEVWKCSVCTLHNSKNISHECELCGGPLERAAPETNSSSSKGREMNKGKEKSLSALEVREQLEYWESLDVSAQYWLCSTCHEQNGHESPNCSHCGEPAPTESHWSCRQCTYDNISSSTTCFICDVPHMMQGPTYVDIGTPRKKRRQFDNPSTIPHHQSLAPSTCALPGCSKQVHVFGYCSQEHLDRASQRNLVAPSEPGVETVIVGPTGDFAVMLLNKAHARHASVKEQFLSSWKKTQADGFPTVERIFRIEVRY